MAVIAGTEYFFRHYVLFWMPILGTLRVNDMAALAMAYSLLTIVFGSLAHAAAIGTTAVLFSLKHAAVDASWGRFLTLVAFGGICGVVAHRHTWRHSAALHLVVNTAATTVGLAIAK